MEETRYTYQLYLDNKILSTFDLSVICHRRGSWLIYDKYTVSVSSELPLIPNMYVIPFSLAIGSAWDRFRVTELLSLKSRQAACCVDILLKTHRKPSVFLHYFKLEDQSPPRPYSLVVSDPACDARDCGFEYKLWISLVYYIIIILLFYIYISTHSTSSCLNV